MGHVSLVACIALSPGPASRSVLTPKSRETPKNLLWSGPKRFPCLKHHRPAPSPPSARGYRGSCSVAIGGGPEEAKPFIGNQSPQSCRSGWSKIWIWTTFEKWLRLSQILGQIAYVCVQLRCEPREPVPPTTPSPAQPPHRASGSNQTSWWHFIIHCIILLCESPPELSWPHRICEFPIKGYKEQHK